MGTGQNDFLSQILKVPGAPGAQFHPALHDMQIDWLTTRTDPQWPGDIYLVVSSIKYELQAVIVAIDKSLWWNYTCCQYSLGDIAIVTLQYIQTITQYCHC